VRLQLPPWSTGWPPPPRLGLEGQGH